MDQWVNFNSIYKCIALRLINNPDFTIHNRKGERTFEMIDYSFRLIEPKNCFATIRNLSLKYLEGEIAFYLSGSPFLKDITKYSKFWGGVTDDGRVINSNYGKLLLHDRNFHGYTQFEYARDMLIQNLDSKKAVMTIYSNENSFPSNDNPCTMYLQFFIRNGEIHLYVNMRSSDIWFGLPYDVPFFILILYKMQKELIKYGLKNIRIGTYNHRAGSLHLYERNKGIVLKCIENSVGTDYSSYEEGSVQLDMFERFVLNNL